MAPLLTGPPAEWIDGGPLAVGARVRYVTTPLVTDAGSASVCCQLGPVTRSSVPFSVSSPLDAP